MEIIDKAYTTLLAEGRVTLQVPEFSLGPCSMSNVSDDYFVRAKIAGIGGRRIAVGREADYGFLYFSRRGFEHYKPELRQVFNTRQTRNGTWQDVEDFADKFFADLKKRSEDHLKRLQLEVQLKNTPYNQKKVADMITALRNIW